MDGLRLGDFDGEMEGETLGLKLGEGEGLILGDSDGEAEDAVCVTTNFGSLLVPVLSAEKPYMTVSAPLLQVGVPPTAS
jgi:hypothetical protein